MNSHSCDRDCSKAEALEGALTDLQMRLTYQDDEIKSLNLAVDRQRFEIDMLRAEIDRIKQLAAALSPAQIGDSQDEMPPHY
jgi:SlyX protein